MVTGGGDGILVRSGSEIWGTFSYTVSSDEVSVGVERKVPNRRGLPVGLEVVGKLGLGSALLSSAGPGSGSRLQWEMFS